MPAASCSAWRAVERGPAADSPLPTVVRSGPGLLGRLTDGHALLRTCAPYASAILLIPWVVLAFWTSPAADDFCAFASERSLGWRVAQDLWYEQRAGRILANAISTGIGWLADHVAGGVWSVLCIFSL